MERNGKAYWSILLVLLLSSLTFAKPSSKHKKAGEVYSAKTIAVSIAPDGSYSILDPVTKKPILHAHVAAEVDHHWIESTDYPQHSSAPASAPDDLGSQTSITVTNTGLNGKPDLTYSIALHSDPDFVTVSAKVNNTGSSSINVQALRNLEASGPAIADLGAPDASDRVLSDSWSEDRPGIKIHDLNDATDGMHRAVGSQLIYNRDTKRNLFLGTLSSDKFVTVLRLHINGDHIANYEVECTGTTELEKENSVQYSPAEDQVELSLSVEPGKELSSERLLISTGTDYQAQMEDYGRLIRQLHHPREMGFSPAGWWSWTAYYFGLDQGTALTNAMWLSQNLKDLGYTFFHIDEGYQYARGEYTTPDANLFPGGMRVLESKVRNLGLTPGIWTAPFEISERSWVFENHKDWLVHNAAGQPIHAGFVLEESHTDPLYVLDSTNPAAQDYLRKTYSNMAKVWGIRYIKLDFMDDSAIEGFYYKPNTTALEAQRIGLKVIREAVGERVLLDKDGSPMLNPVGLVDTGRISVDTGHTFESSKEAAPGVAARFFMNHNYYLADPDAFTVSRQTVDEQEWHGGKRPLTLDEAKVSIALAAIAGGMYEIGDDLPTLGEDADRVALVKNQDLMNMARLGHSSIPLDLMSYSAEDEMPSIFLLKESKRQSMLTVFNWTEKPTEHKFSLGKDLGLQLQGHSQVTDVFDGQSAGDNLEMISVSLSPRSAKVLKIVDTSIPAAAPTISFEVQDEADAGKSVPFFAKADAAGVPAVHYRWDFGDGTQSDQPRVEHAYTHPGDFTVKLHVDGLDGIPFDKTMMLKVNGRVETRFHPNEKKRFTENP